MSNTSGLMHSAVHTASLVCEAVTATGLPLDPARLRSWHTREGLAVGEGEGWRRYSDFDVLEVALLRSLSAAGIPAGELAPVLPLVRGEVEAAMRFAAQDERDLDNDLFVAALRREGKPLLILAGYRDGVLDRAGRMAGLTPLPLTLLNLSTLAVSVRAALVARQSK